MTLTAQRGAAPVPAPIAPALRDDRPVTAERLKNPEDKNWLTIRRTYDGWGFSPLTQITSDDVAWAGVSGGHGEEPIAGIAEEQRHAETSCHTCRARVAALCGLCVSAISAIGFVTAKQRGER